jgi:adenylyltransferase/sulfurtransferase
MADDREAVRVEAETVDDALRSLTDRHGELRDQLYDDEGRLRSFVNVYLGDRNVRELEDGHRLEGEAEISIVPSIAGGSSVEPAAPGRTDGAADGTGLRSLVEGRELPELGAEEIRRYGRHLTMPEVGREGQRRLKSARVLMVGAGGLGSPVGMYLAAAGVGHLGIVDFDTVEFSNLHRQILHDTDGVGRSKLASARDRLEAINPGVEVEAHETRLTSENALEIFEGYDLVIDGSDNFPTRYLVNDASVLTGIPSVYGAIFRFDGQASVFGTEEGPCYRCLFREPPPAGLVPSCAEAGVLGILPGLVGTIQATEAIKMILGRGSSLAGRLLLVDTLEMEFREVEIRKDPDCPVCGEDPTVTELIDYEEFCGVQQGDDSGARVPSVTVEELRDRVRSGDDLQILDVREDHEWEICNLEELGAFRIPLGDLPQHLHELDDDREMVVHCRSGGRSAKAVDLLRQAGFPAVNLEGGILAWAEEIDDEMPTY